MTEDTMSGATPAPISGADIRTFLIADVRGYTLFTQERGDEAAGRLAARFAEITGEIVEARGGTLLELRGDEALCVFSSARDAIRVATDLQRRFVEETLATPELPLTVGIGLDAGEAVRVGDGYRGGALNLAARLCGRARAGEILGSQEVTHLARAIEGVRYEDRGAMRFKNLSDPVSVVRIVATDGDAMTQLRPFAAKSPRPTRRSAAVLAAVAGVAVLAGVAIASRALTSGTGGPATISPNTLARLNPASGSVGAAFRLRARPGGMAIGFGSAWVVDPEHNEVVRIRLTDGSVADTIQVGHSPAGIVIGDGAVWVTNAADGTVDRIPPKTNTVSDVLPAGSTPTGIAVGGGALWVADHVGAALLRIDPVSGRSVAVPLDGLPSAVAFTPHGVWVAVSPGSVERVQGDRVTGAAHVGEGPSAVADAFGSIWVASELDSTVTRVDPSTASVGAAVPVAEGPSSLASAGGRLWVSSPQGGSLAAIDPASDSVVTTIPVSGDASSLAAGRGDLWLGAGPSATEHRGGTLRVSAGAGPLSTIDTAASQNSLTWQILAMTNDGLLAYRKVGGPDGVTIVPDLAAALPEVSQDGLTYRFAVRRGVTYSNGDPVRPIDFRRALERSIALNGDAHVYYQAIEGADACHAKPSSCDLSKGIEVGDRSVTFRLAYPDSDLLFKLALPFAFAVPANTPIQPVRFSRPLPATGPYAITEVSAHSLRLERNPRFREWSASAQPDGYPDGISISFGLHGNAFGQLAARHLDVMLTPPSPKDLALARAQYPERVFESTAPQTLFVALDTAKPPFDDERVRQAVSYAIDRARLVDLLGGTGSMHVTCQTLPPNFQGYIPYCPFTHDPGTSWSAPDVNRARKLVKQAGAIGVRVRVWADSKDPQSVELMKPVTSVLKEIGLRARLEVVPEAKYYQGSFAPAGSTNHPDVLSYNWYNGYPGAWEFLYEQYGCGANWNVIGYCNHGIDRRMREARSLQISDPGAANRKWAEVEHDLVDQAALVAVANPISTFVVSDRAGDVQVNPQFGVLLSQIWVR